MVLGASSAEDVPALGATADFQTGQVTIASATSTQIIAPNAYRRFLTIVNNSGQSIYLGSSSSVTESNGLELPTGSALNIVRRDERITGPMWGRAPSTATTLPKVSYLEV